MSGLTGDARLIDFHSAKNHYYIDTISKQCCPRATTISSAGDAPNFVFADNRLQKAFKDTGHELPRREMAKADCGHSDGKWIASALML